MELIPDTIDFSGYYHDEQVTEHQVLPASSWLEAVMDHFFKPEEFVRSVRLGWVKTHADFAFRPAEVTLWGGINGHGKSQVLGQVGLDLMCQGERVGVASLELPPAMVMSRMVRQANGSSRPLKEYVTNFHGWTDNRLWLYDHVGSSDPRTILAMIRYSVAKFGITHFIVDNLAKVIKGEGGTDVYNAQKDFINGLCSIAHDTGVHIHLALHVKKKDSEADVPGKFDIKGSGSITDLVDNIFIVWRNKPKESAIREGKADKNAEPDAIIVLEKQRNGEAEGQYNLWFDPSSFQYVEHRHDHPRQYELDTQATFENVNF